MLITAKLTKVFLLTSISVDLSDKVNIKPSISWKYSIVVFVAYS